MVPTWILILVIVLFFIRDLRRGKSKEESTDSYQNGYKKALSDITDVWNSGLAKKYTPVARLNQLYDSLLKTGYVNNRK